MASTIKNFRLNVVLRVLIIAALSIVFAFIINNTEWLFTPLFLSILMVVVIISLIRYVEKINNDLTQFIYNIKQGGFTTLMKSGTSEGSKLGQVFNEVIEEFKKISIEKESHYQYLKTLNENIGVSIISYSEDGKITLTNPAAKSLLKKPYLKHIDELGNIDKNLLVTIKGMQSGQREVLKAFIDGEMIQLSIQVKKFVLQEVHFNVVLLQNIHVELEQKEVEAWQKLISVLTHEIMNSVTPIASLSTAVNRQLDEENKWEIMDTGDRQDIIKSLKTIENRSKGLIKFVNAYKDFSRTPDLKLEGTDLIALLERIIALLLPDIKKAKIKLIEDIKMKELSIRIDHELMEQVFINILKNALEALENVPDGVIKVTLRQSGNEKILMEFSDNGIGMDKETVERIFIPFYTTKKRGTGIGLSFTRQVMRLHGGLVKVKSEVGKGTSVILEF